MRMRSGAVHQVRVPESVIPPGEGHLRRTIREYVAYDHHERNHQGLENELIVRVAPPRASGAVRRDQRLGGILNYYYRAA